MDPSIRLHVLLLLGSWMIRPGSGLDDNDPAADLDQDGIVGAADLGLLVASWGVCP